MNICIIPLRFPSYLHEYPLAFGSRFCHRHPPYQVLHSARQRDRPAHGSANLGRQTASTKLLLGAVTGLFDRIVDVNLLVRRVNITANHVVDEASAQKKGAVEQLDLFTDYSAVQAQKEAEEGATTVDRNRQIGGHKA